MRWEELTYPDFEKAVQTCQGVGLVPVGVIEPHSAHLPLGTDMMACHWVACRAAEGEPVLVFPPYGLGVNHEGMHLPGAVVIKRDLIFALLENICEEMARNGLKKIILTSGHGGNRYLLPLLVQTLVEKKPDYLVYYAAIPSTPGANKVLESDETGHACEAETSRMLQIRPDLVKMEDIPEPFTSRRGNEALKEVGAYSPVDWYSMYPNMYVGDARTATAEKGKVLNDARVEPLIRLIKAVKEDEVTPGLLEQFNRGGENPKSPY